MESSLSKIKSVCNITLFITTKAYQDMVCKIEAHCLLLEEDYYLIAAAILEDTNTKVKF